METKVQDDLTSMSRKALVKIMRAEGNDLDDGFEQLTTDELRAAHRQYREDHTTKPPITPVDDSLWRIKAMPIHQLGHDAFIASIKYRDLGRLIVDREVQRDLAKRRLSDISNYVAGENGYFGAVVVTVTGTPVYDNGDLVLDASCAVVINDGQHRVGGIRKAINEPGMLDRMDDDLPVVIYASLDKHEQRQLFADINLHALKPNRAIALDYNDRDLLVRFAKDLVQKSVFDERVNFLKTKVSARDPHLFTFSAVVDAVENMFDNLTPATYDTYLTEAIEFWTEVSEALGQHWQARDFSVNKNALVATARLYGMNVDWPALASLDWSTGGELETVARTAGGSNAAIKALADKLALDATVTE